MYWQDEGYLISKNNYDENSLKTQDNLRKLNGKNNLYFAGSYFGNGFHEDAVRSAFQAYNDFVKKGN